MWVRIATFIVLTVGAFMLLGRSIPQISSEGAEPIEIGQTPDELVRAGRAIFERENSCLTCHSIGEDPKARCPDQQGVWTRAATRRPDLTAAAYLVESVYDPNAFIVEGYPKNQMKPVNLPPIALTDDEILAVLCYLASLSAAVDAPLVEALRRAQEPYRAGRITVADAGGGITLLEGDPEDGFDVYQEMRCFQCHLVFGEGATDTTGVGPDLSSIGAIQTPEYLAESILNPNAVIARGEGYVSENGMSRMPEYHDTLTLRQWLDLIAYLSTLQGSSTRPP